MNRPTAFFDARSCRRPLLAVALLALSAGLALAQPEGPREGPREGPPPADAPGEAPARRPNAERAANPEMAKQRLRRMIEEHKRRGERLEQAMRELESGKDPLEVMREIAAERMRGERQGQDREAGPQGPMGGPEGREGPDGREGPGERGREAEGGPREGGDRDLNGLGGVIEMSGPSRPLSDAEREKVKGILRERLPRVAERIESFSAQEPAIARALLDRVGARVMRAEEARRDNPELADLRLAEIDHGADAIEAMRTWRRAKRDNDSAAGEAATAKLREAIAKIFDVRVKLRENELQQLTRRLDTMRADLGRFQSERETVVERTFKQMTERGPGMRGPKGPENGPAGENRRGKGRDGESKPPAQPRE